MSRVQTSGARPVEHQPQIPGGNVHTVRTTINPEVEVQVGDAELIDLERWGLVVKSQATTPEGLRRAATKQVAANTEKEDDQ